MKRFAIGSDIGGSHISCALVDIVEGHIVEDSFFERSIDNQASAKIILSGWAAALHTTIEKVGKEAVAGIGFAMPGPFAYDKGIAMFEKVAKFENLYGINVASELKNMLALNDSLPLRFMNDASAFACGEAWLGAASDVAKSISITLGTGFGSAFIENGIPLVEGDGVPSMGCVWHLPFKDGIADESFTTRWFTKHWKEITGEDIDGVKPIAEKAVSNPEAKALFAEYGRNIGSFMGPWLRNFNASVLVIGGNISWAWDLFRKPLEAAIAESGADIKIAISTLKESAAIIGSARMIDQDFWEKVKPVLPEM